MYNIKPTTSAFKGIARCIGPFANKVKNIACEAFVWYMVASFSHAWARLLTCTQLLVSCNRGTNWFQGNAAMTASHTAGLAAWIRLARAHMALHRLSSSGSANICTIAGRPADCTTLSCMEHNAMEQLLPMETGRLPPFCEVSRGQEIACIADWLEHGTLTLLTLHGSSENVQCMSGTTSTHAIQVEGMTALKTADSKNSYPPKDTSTGG